MDIQCGKAQSFVYQNGELKINGMTVEEIRPLFENESCGTKMVKLFVALFMVCLFGSMGIVTALRASNVGSIQDAYDQQCQQNNDCLGGKFYDWNYGQGPFTDQSEADKLIAELIKDCDNEC